MSPQAGVDMIANLFLLEHSWGFIFCFTVNMCRMFYPDKTDRVKHICASKKKKPALCSTVNHVLLSK